MNPGSLVPETGPTITEPGKVEQPSPAIWWGKHRKPGFMQRDKKEVRSTEKQNQVPFPMKL